MPIGERLKGERERLGLSQTEFGVAAGVGRKTQFNYESDERAPDAIYLAFAAELGVDVRYVVTGARDYEPPPVLTAEEQVMLGYFREASPELRRAAIGALLSAKPPVFHDPGKARQVFNAKVGTAVAGDVTNLTQHAPPKRKR